MTRRASVPYVLCLIAAWLCSPTAWAQHSTASAHPLPQGRAPEAMHPVVPYPVTPAERGSAPPNDECANATPITLVDPSACGTSMIAGTTAGAVPTMDDPACTTSTTGYADVWYTFNSGTHTEVLITLDPEEDISYWAFALQTTCDPASETACMLFPDPSVPVAVAVAPNTDYLVRCFTNLDFGATPGNFLLCVAYQPFFPPPANDECTAAAAISVVDINDCGTSSTQGTTLGTTIVHDAPDCDNSNVGFADVWYAFNSGTHDEIYVTMTPDANVADWGFAVQASCDAGTEVGCQIHPIGPRLVHVTPNTDYLVRCFNNLRYGARGGFSLCVAALPFVAPPANDHCTDVVPEALAVGSQLTFTGDVSGATGTDDFEAGSEFEGEQAVWHAFTTTECADVVISYCGTATAFNNVYLVLSPGCPIGSNALFNTAWGSSCPNGNANILFAQLPPGTYYLPVMRDYVSGSYGPYSITVSAASCTAIPVNDRCADVVPVDIPVGNTQVFQGVLTAATSTDDFEAGSIWDGSNAAVWHAFTITECADITLSYCDSPFPIGIFYYHLVTSCPASSDSLAGETDFFSCANGNAIVRFHGIPAGTYYIPVMSDPANNATGPYTLTVEVEACPLPPPNDECIGATPLIPGDTCTPVNATALAATQSLPPTLCGALPSSNAMDVWFSFVANSTHETITVFGHNDFDAIVQLFAGGCSALDSIDCADETFFFFNPVNEVLERGDFVVGQTYYVRVYDYGAFAQDQTFGICVESSDGTGVEEQGARPLFGVFPNPNDGDFTLSYLGPDGPASIDLLDVTGRSLTGQRRDLRNGQQVTLGFSGRVSPGTYLLQVIVNGVRSEQRVLIK